MKHESKTSVISYNDHKGHSGPVTGKLQVNIKPCMYNYIYDFFSDT